MKLTTLLSILAAVAYSSASIVARQDIDSVAEAILANAASDNIDLTVLDFLDTALEEISNATTLAIERRSSERRATPSPNNIFDVHTHVVPSWYKLLVPTTGGNPTPDWTFNSHLSFMETQGIDRAVFAFSAPGPNVYVGKKLLTVALARLINEQTAAYRKANPTKFKFYAHVPLPYTAEAIVEAKYALTRLGASGIVLQSNVEGRYLGDATFTPFFDALNKLGGRQILYIHPADPVVKVKSQLVSANPTQYPAGSIEFYFETARTLMDLTLTQTIHNFTNIHYVIPHAGGAFPTTVDRILKSRPQLYDSSFEVFNTRFWWDSAGPTYFHQISGLLGINVPRSQLLYGTDFPYAPAVVQPGSLAAVKSSNLFTADEKTAIFTTNAEALFGRF
ncbi:hypothetical protein CPC08DRAFT_664696 [Agrocybe pediades]|nr:hypothetical protein CPC08DRAFT_664696 [Agrocybe pediades]